MGWKWPEGWEQNGAIEFDAILPTISSGESYPLSGGPNVHIHDAEEAVAVRPVDQTQPFDGDLHSVALKWQPYPVPATAIVVHMDTDG